MSTTGLDNLSFLRASSNMLNINLASYCLNLFLFGILTIQTYLYYIAFPRDTLLQKWMVLTIYLLDAAQTAVALFDFYLNLCTTESVAYGQNIWFTVYISGGLVAFITQLVYVRRIWMLSKNRIIIVLLVLLALVQFILSLLIVIELKQPFLFALHLPVSSFILWGPPGIICDILIATYMCYYLSKQLRKSIAMPKRTSLIVNRIRRLVLETGLLTVLVTCAYTATLAYTLDFFIISGLNIGKIYSNSLLVMLNSRWTIIGGRHTEDDFCVSLYAEPDDTPSTEARSQHKIWRFLVLPSFLLRGRRGE